MRDVKAVYVSEGETGPAVVLKTEWPHPQDLGVLDLPPEVETFEQAQQFVRGLFEKAGCVVEEDPHDKGVLHIFHPE